MAVTLALDSAFPAPVPAQPTLTPDKALQTLMDGNRRYVEHGLQSFSDDLAILRQGTVEKQQPFAAILSCADSRVPPEIVFDQNIGKLFVTRIAGNVATTEVIASLEFAAAVLGTPLIMVMAHGNCGAVKAAIAAKDVPGQISALYAPLEPAVEQAGNDLKAVTDANARIQVRILSKASPVLAELIKAGKLKIVASVYNLDSGRVELLE